ncbi:MAG: magnesium/cobalt transporter CorA, partial [Bacteroidetes bacterium]|nr:magnesium/cobalt transporter CorA [Fibrella sp.]
FAPVLDRIKAAAGKTRKHGADYLLYALMDLIVDNYFLVLERIGDSLDTLEDVIIQNKADQATLSSVYALKREVTFMRRMVWPLRDVLSAMLREESHLIAKSTLPFLRDLADHVNQLIETLDAYRELTTGLVEVYLSSASNRMNSVMKTLTIFSAIFMPLTFIVGIYGMNFDNMPELRTQSGYFWVLGFMAALTTGMIVYFRRRGWL